MTVDGKRRSAGGRRRGASRAAAFATGLFLLASLVAVALALAGQWGGLAELGDGTVGAGWRVRPFWLLAALGCGTLALWCSGALWGALFRSAGGRVPLGEATAIWLGSNLGRYLPGKIWQVTGLVGYVRTRGDSGSPALAALLVFQAVTLVAAGGLGLALLGTSAFGEMGAWPVVLGALAIAALLAPPVLRRITSVGRRLLREPPDEAVQLPLGRARLARLGTAGLLVWLMHGLGFWALLQGLLPENPVGPLVASGVFSASYVAGYVALVAPGGIIVREGAMAGLLATVAGISPAPAAALALTARLWTTAAELLALGPGLLIARSAGRPQPPSPAPADAE